MGKAVGTPSPHPCKPFEKALTLNHNKWGMPVNISHTHGKELSPLESLFDSRPARTTWHRCRIPRP